MTEAKLGRPARPLLAVIFLFILLGLYYVWQVPPFEGPDEPQHFAYIEWLVRTNTFPPQGDAAWETPVEQEGGQPPLYYLLASIPARIVGVDRPSVVFHVNPHAFSSPYHNLDDNNNRALHRPGEVSTLRGGWLSYYLARLLTVSFGVLLLISVYGLTRQVVPSRPQVAIVATLLVAITPQVLFIGSVVSNDIPAAALATATLWLLARQVRQGTSPRLALTTGAVFGFATITKVSTLALAVPLALGLLWLWRSGRQTLREVLQTGLGIGVSAFVVTGWWFVRAWYLYGSPLGLESHNKAPWAIRDPSQVPEFLKRWQDIFRSFWFAFGWGTIRPDGWVYLILAVFVLLGLLGVAIAFKRMPFSEQEHRTTGILLLLLVVTFFVVSFLLELWMRRVSAPLGRLLFPVVGAVVIFLTLGWHSLHPRLALVPVVFLAGFAATAPQTVMKVAYEPPALLAATEAQSLEDASDIYFSPGEGEPPVMRLLSATVLEQQAKAEGVVSARLCWQALAPMEHNYTVLVHLLGPNNWVVEDRHTYHGLGRYPSSRWRPGEALCDVVRILVPEDLQKTLLYKVEIALLDVQEDRRLIAQTTDGQPVGIIYAGSVKLVAANPPVVSSLPGSGPIQLLEYDVQPVWSAGQSHQLVLRWGVSAPIHQDYQVFVHMRDPETGDMVAQGDGPPLNEWYPTSWWAPNEIVVDERTMTLPEDVMPGRYELVVGFYSLQTGQRFGEEHSLGNIEVVQ